MLSPHSPFPQLRLLANCLELTFLKPAGYRGMPMLRKDAEHEIIREWMNLPETERQSEHQAPQFALKMKRKYPFDYASGDG